MMKPTGANAVAERGAELAQLLAQVALGNRAAFESLYAATKAKLFAVSLRIVRERHIAEEVLQDSFVKIWSHASDYAIEKSAPLTWMATIVRNRSLDIVRRPHIELADEDDALAALMVDDAPSALDQLAARRDEGQLARCMQALDGEQRKSIALAFFEGLSHSEIAEKVQRPLGTVKTQIRRGLLKLRGCLDGHVQRDIGAQA
jgi:RNA polymerase sigma-70 factor, ECF subfamily